ncbi:7173_t:CDS:2 [Cetraspora pellucida]|uniref:7173_t:CDS:1 n=1 Tax=Cetraspora pellucida TaxID=1433469 RepID=A0A9N9EPC0_9GLOM|nr:7173_t:CDS:2 [Cetraspora pellucida]
MVNGQQYIDENYPITSRGNITELDLSNKNLEGTITFNNSGFINLLKLNLSSNMITNIHYELPSILQIDVSHNFLSNTRSYSSSTIRKLNCSFNKITVYNLNAPNLTHFDCSNNLVSSLDISSNVLEELICSRNPITLVPLNITSKLTSFDCVGIQFNKTSTILTSSPISPTSPNSFNTSPNSFDNFSLVA